MSRISLDGEEVNFEGPPPGSVAEVWALIENHLAGAGALVDRFLVDGVDWDPETGAVPDRYETIEIRSISHRESAARLAREWVSGGEALRTSWKEGASRSLRTPWSDFQAKSIEILQQTEPLIGSLNALRDLAQQQGLACFDDLTETTNSLSGALETAIDAIEAGACVAYSDAAAGVVYQALGDTISVLETEVAPQLQEGGAK